MRLAIVQLLPIEYYPPVANFLRFLAEQGEHEIEVYSVDNTKGRPPFACPGVRILRTASPRPGDSQLQRYLSYLRILASTFRWLRSFSPDVVIYYEPHSALPVFLYWKLGARDTRIAIHHHEYYDPHQFGRPGMRLPSLAHRSEKRTLFREAAWISQTNEKRRELFLRDHPKIDPAKVRVLPNYPPACWQRTENRAWKKASETLRLVYVGSVSREDTYIEPLLDWLEKQPDGGSDPVTLDLYAYNVPEKTDSWLRSRESERFRYHRKGVDYERLPEVLADFHVGLILYRGNTTNFIWNAPNKLFEYLACGLDVWYPPVMQGMTPYRSEDTRPAVVEVDFEDPSAFPVAKTEPGSRLLLDRASFTCESVYRNWMRALSASL